MNLIPLKKCLVVSLQRINFTKSLFAIVTLTLLLPSQRLLAQSSENPTQLTSEQARQQTFVAATGKIFLLGIGADLVLRLDGQNAIGVTAEANTFIVDETLFGGVIYQRFLGNSFFTRLGFGAADFSSYDSDKAVPAVDVLVGNEWIVNETLILGADWIRGTLGFSSSETSSKSRIYWPKFRIGVTF